MTIISFYYSDSVNDDYDNYDLDNMINDDDYHYLTDFDCIED